MRTACLRCGSTRTRLELFQAPGYTLPGLPDPTELRCADTDGCRRREDIRFPVPALPKGGARHR